MRVAIESGKGMKEKVVKLCWNKWNGPFLSDPGKPGVRSLGPDVRHWLRETPCWDLTDVTLADEDTNSILTDNANRAIQGNVAMQVTQPGGQICN